MRRHADQGVGGQSLRMWALVDRGWWEEGMSPGAEELKWERYLAGVAKARFKQWGDNATILAISGVLNRMVVVRSVSASQTLSLFEIEPPSHWSDSQSSGVPLIVSHLCDYHYMPVRIRREGLWGWVADAGVGVSWRKELKSGSAVAMREDSELTPGRIFSPQRRSDSRIVVEQRMRGSGMSTPTSGRTFSPQRRLVSRGLVRGGAVAREEIGLGAGSYAGVGATFTKRTLSVDRWFSERAASLARGAESGVMAWGIARKGKEDQMVRGKKRREGKGC